MAEGDLCEACGEPCALAPLGIPTCVVLQADVSPFFVQQHHFHIECIPDPEMRENARAWRRRVVSVEMRLN